MEKYKVDYVILGDLERSTFGGEFLAKKLLPHTKEAFAIGRTSIRAGWTTPIEDLTAVTIEGRPDRTNENPPVPQGPLPSSRTVGQQGSAASQFNEPRGVDVGFDGRIYVADSQNARIQVFTSAGDFERIIPDPSETNPRAALNGEYSGPGDVAVDGEGNVYVADTWGSPPTGGHGRIVKYDSQGRFVTEWSSPRGFHGPRGIDIAPNGAVYVADTGPDRVQVFSSNGRFEFTWGKEGEMKGEFIEPVGIAVHQDRVYVCDTGNHRIQIFDLRGQWMGDVTPYGWAGHPVGIEPHIDLDSQGRIFVTDSARGRLEVFSPAGDPIQHCYVGLSHPKGVAVSGSVGVVSEASAHRVRIFAVP
jgi:tripartite motif-containing protein 71